MLQKLVQTKDYPREKHMKLSIITVCFNIKDEIRRTCESIVNQTYQDFEWIVVDGGSTDGTLEILEEYKERINIFISEKDNGIYDAMNKGIARARGEYLNFMNGGDCFYNLNVLQDSIQALASCADVYYGNVQVTSAANTYILNFPKTLSKEFFLRSCINHQSCFIKAELFALFGNYKIVAMGSDFEMWLIYMKNNRTFVKLDRCIAQFYLGGASSRLEHMPLRRAIYNEYFTKEDFLNFYMDEKQSALMRMNKANTPPPSSPPKTQPSPEVISITLFGFIKFLEISRTPTHIRIILFKVFPLLMRAKSNTAQRYYLFNKIPLVTIKKEERKS